MTARHLRRGKVARLVPVAGGQALTAIGAQLSQALGSFLLQLLAARLLGAAGLGEFALVYGVILTATAVGTGLVGDSLTILDRSQSRLRGALQLWAIVTPLAGGLLTVAGALGLRVVSAGDALLFGLALAAFLLEDTMRRLLMATMFFTSVIIVDTVSLVGSLATLGVVAALRPLSLGAFLAALLVGQALAAAAAVVLLPVRERTLAPWRGSAVAEVARFGLWRAGQQALRPAMLTVSRALVALAVGKLLFGQLEAARVYMAPALLLIQGVGSYLMSSYARTRDRPTAELARRADRASAVLLGAALLVGAVGTALAPFLGPVVTGSSYSMRPLAVFGWAVYAASSAAVMPFASLAAVRGRQARVLSIRLADSCLSVLLVAVVVLALSADVSWSPYVMAIGSFVGGAAIRSLVLRPLARTEVREPAMAGRPLS